MEKPTRSPNLALECPDPFVKMCVEDRCSCHAPYTRVPERLPVITGMPPATMAQCHVTIGYDPSYPEVPSLHFSGGECAMSAEIAISVGLAYFLRMSGSRPPVHKP